MDVLDGIRVVDFGRYIAGPFCATLLGDLGADVIRVERREGGEDRWVTPVTADGVGSLFLQVGRNKRSLTLAPDTDEGYEVVTRLVATADVVVANLPPPTLRSMRLDYDSLRAIKPDIILTTVTAFGSGGAHQRQGRLRRPGPVDVGQPPHDGPGRGADPGRGPLRRLQHRGRFSAFATLAALRHRDLTGEGQVLEGALLRSALNHVQLDADRAAAAGGRPGGQPQPGSDRRSLRRVPDQGRLGDVQRHRGSTSSSAGARWSGRRSW